jgi:MFS superfamily sulfate permease-like transporter
VVVTAFTLAAIYTASFTLGMLWGAFLNCVDWIDRLVNPRTRARIKRHNEIVAQFRRGIETHNSGRM